MNDAFSLRRFLASLPAGELIEHGEPVALTGVAAILERTAPAVLFRSVGPERAELAGNVMSNRSRSRTPSASRRARFRARSCDGLRIAPS